MTQPKHASTSRTQPQAVRPADPAARTAQSEDGATAHAPNCTSFATMDLRRQVPQEVERRSTNRINIQEGYEFNFVYQNIVQEPVDYEVPVVSSAEDH